MLDWHDIHGRHDLPWTRDRTPYRVWLSEIMLQQTQVATVIPYFARFTATFPDVFALAAAPVDDVLHLWSGLGYYSRARNLHKTAVIIATEHRGEFPRDVAGLAALPGIGRSTAGAIVAQAWDKPAAILDGNVKRVLARHHAIAGWPGDSAVMKALWQLAESHLPRRRFRDYTQAMMDLGATVCTRTRPACASCPLAATCMAHAQGAPTDFPGKRARKKLPERHTTFLVVQNHTGAVLLEQRPPQGIWGGLWSFPECAESDEAETRLAPFGLHDWEPAEPLPAIVHTFTHFRLHIAPIRIRTRAVDATVSDNDRVLWYDPAAPARVGLAKPVQQILKKLHRTPG